MSWLIELVLNFLALCIEGLFSSGSKNDDPRQDQFNSLFGGVITILVLGAVIFLAIRYLG